MKHPIIRAVDLEFALITQIRKEGSQELINALQDCQIRVESYGDWTYATMTFPGHYSSQVTWDLMNEVGWIGLPLGIFPCDGESAAPTTMTIVVDPDAFEQVFEKLRRMGLEDGGES